MQSQRKNSIFAFECDIKGCLVSIDVFAIFECGVGNGRDFFFEQTKGMIYTSIIYTNTEYIMVICLLFCLPFSLNVAFDFNYKSAIQFTRRDIFYTLENEITLMYIL